MRWARAAGALALAVAVSGWVGWTRFAAQEPQPSAVLTAAAPVEYGNARFTVVGWSRPASVDDGDGNLAEPMAGAAFVRLDLREEALGAVDELYCDGWLSAGADRWQNTTDVGPVRAGRCSTNADGDPLAVGRARDLSFYWEVPAAVADGPLGFELRFGDDAAIMVRP
ncbi:MAG: hypothetical protein KDB60_07980 [Propionibacteriaceae bacterium]|nr:hypothetical protein [Propionibacteriaceae bacterium]